MPYDKAEPAAWWKGAEAVPPASDEAAQLRDLKDEIERRLQAFLAYTGPPRVDPDTSDVVRAVAAHGVSQQAAEVRAGDQVERAGIVAQVSALHEASDGTVAGMFCAGSRGYVLVRDIGPPGSGKPWTVLPREPAPERGMGAAGHDVPADTGAVVPRDADVRIAVFAPDGSALAPVPVAPDADTAGILAAGHAGLARIEARNAALRVADAVPDSRREAERRVVEAARVFRARRNNSGMFRAGCDLDAALDALAALDGEGGA